MIHLLSHRLHPHLLRSMNFGRKNGLDDGSMILSVIETGRRILIVLSRGEWRIEMRWVGIGVKGG
jgi:hypothetical protein